MFGEDDDAVIRPVFGRSKLSYDRRSSGAASTYSEEVARRSDKSDAEHADHIPSTLTRSIAPPKAVHAAIKAIEKALIETGENFDQDVDNWVICTSGGPDVTPAMIIHSANSQFGGCPFQKTMAHFGIEMDTNRVLAKIEGHGFCVVQIFRNVSLSKLLLVWRIASPYIPTRRLVGSPKTQADFEADAAMWHAVGDAYELAWDLPNQEDPAQRSLFEHIETTYKNNADRFAGRTRHSTTQFDDQKDYLKYIN